MGVTIYGLTFGHNCSVYNRFFLYMDLILEEKMTPGVKECFGAHGATVRLAEFGINPIVASLTIIVQQHTFGNALRRIPLGSMRSIPVKEGSF